MAGPPRFARVCFDCGSRTESGRKKRGRSKAQQAKKSASDKKVKADKVGEWITRKTKSQGVTFLGKNKGLSRSDGYLTKKDSKPELFQDGASMIVIPHAGGSTEEEDVGVSGERLLQGLG
jgi:hypothetical protein